jgi:Fe-S cluster biogenesis protein NfuA
MTVRMHTETTQDPAVMQWVVNDDLVRGSANITPGQDAIDELPEELADLIAFGTVERLVVSPGTLSFQAPHADQWPELVGQVQQILTRIFDAGTRIDITSSGVDDLALAEGVQRLLAGPLADYVASHDGEISLMSVSDGIVTVELDGACRGCPSSTTTLKVGIEEQLRAEFPEITEVRSVEAQATPDSRIYLPIITL